MGRVWGEAAPNQAYSGRGCRDPAGPGGASEPLGRRTHSGDRRRQTWPPVPLILMWAQQAGVDCLEPEGCSQIDPGAQHLAAQAPSKQHL